MSGNDISRSFKKSMEKTTQSSKQLSRDFIKLSHKATPENPGLYGGMRPSDGASTSDGSGLEISKMIDLMQKIISDKQDIAHRLEQANQKNQELTNKLKQVIREKEEVAHQLKEVRLGETSSLQKGESSSLLVNWEKLTSWTKYFYPSYFAQTPTGEAWFDKHMDDWVFTKEGRNYMRRDAHQLFKTAPGERWFERKGNQ